MKRNWRSKYQRTLPTIKENQRDSSNSESEEYKHTSPSNNYQKLRRQQFNKWLSIICYSTALTILISIIANSHTVNQGLPDEEFQNNLQEPTEPIIVEDIINQVIQEPEQTASFNEYLQSLYLVIIGAVFGYIGITRLNTSH